MVHDHSPAACVRLLREVCVEVRHGEGAGSAERAEVRACLDTLQREANELGMTPLAAAAASLAAS